LLPATLSLAANGSLARDDTGGDFITAAKSPSQNDRPLPVPSGSLPRIPRSRDRSASLHVTAAGEG